MTDIGAAMGLAGLHEFDQTLAHRQKLFQAYKRGLAGIEGITLMGANTTDRTHAAWLCTALVDKRIDFMNKLRSRKIESGQVHYRNDRYTVLGGRRDDLPFMDSIEENYIVLPLHLHMNEKDVEYICQVIKSGW